MIIKRALLFITYTLVFFSVYGRTETDMDKSIVFINNQMVSNGESISISNGTNVTYEIKKISDLPVILDPTGQKIIRYDLQENVKFTTTYNPGQYSPSITIGNDTLNFKLKVDEKYIDWIPFLQELIWPITILVIFLVLFIWGGLRKLLSSLTTAEIEIGNIKFKPEDTWKDISTELNRIQEDIFSTYIDDVPTQFLPSSIEKDISYDIHVFEFINAIGIKPKDDNHKKWWSKSWTIVGNFYSYDNKEKAKNAYEKAIRIDKDNPIPYANIGMIYYTRDKNNCKAEAYFKKAIKIAEYSCVECSTAYMGMTLISCNKYKNMEDEKKYSEKAKNMFKKETENNPCSIWNWYGLGWCWSYGDKDYEKAIEYTRKALDIRDDFHAARYNLACFQSLGNQEEKCMETLKELLNPSKKILTNYDFDKDKDFLNVSECSDFNKFCTILGYEDTPKMMKETQLI